MIYLEFPEVHNANVQYKHSMEQNIFKTSCHTKNLYTFYFKLTNDFLFPHQEVDLERWPQNVSDVTKANLLPLNTQGSLSSQFPDSSFEALSLSLCMPSSAWTDCLLGNLSGEESLEDSAQALRERARRILDAQNTM